MILKETGKLILLVTIILSASCDSKPKIANLQDKYNTAPLNDDGEIVAKSYYNKTVYYGTTRYDRCSKNDVSFPNKECSGNISRYDTGNRSSNVIKYGIVKVEIPFIKPIGETTGMSISYLKNDIGWLKFREKISKDDLVIFIHGFNTPFKDAAIRTAQLAHDTNYVGEAVFYSWPSGGEFTEYAIDQKNAKLNFSHFADFLQNIAQSSNKKIHIIAHSMGGYILSNALVVLDKRMKKDVNLFKNRPEKNVFNQIIFAAPDIEKKEFKDNMESHRLKRFAERMTLYSTNNDYVLKVSRGFNYFINNNSKNRTGDSSDQDFVLMNGLDTVDARREIPKQFFGHSFYANNRSLVSDIYQLLNYGTHPDKRILQKALTPDNGMLWLMQD